MTENKRFTIEPILIRECIVDNTTGEQLDTFDYTERLCELLNELHEENAELHIQNDFLKNENQHMRKLVNENEQLKQLLNEAEDIILCQTTPHYQRQWENIKNNIKGDVE